MKTELTKNDVLKILLRHLGITDYVEFKHLQKIGLPQDEIYWEGNPKPPGRISSDKEHEEMCRLHKDKPMISSEDYKGDKTRLTIEKKNVSLDEKAFRKFSPPLNLYPKIILQQNEIMARLEKSEVLNLIRFDSFSLRNKEKEITIELQKVKLLSYTEDSRSQIVPWHKLVIYSEGKIGYDSSLGFVGNVLKELDLKKFRDEDAPGQGEFYGTAITGKYYGYCYINPDYPNGYWENHALETEAEL